MRRTHDCFRVLTVIAVMMSHIAIVKWSLAANDKLTLTPPSTIDQQALDRIITPPAGLPPVPVPVDNPLTVAKIRLGRKLFFDRRLSHNNTMSCAMCHVPEQGFTVNSNSSPLS